MAKDTTSLRERLMKNSTIKETAPVDVSPLFNKKDMIKTDVPMINVALAGRIDGGLTPGLTILAGPSKHFKTAFALLMTKAFLDANPDDGVVLFYDSEFGTPTAYFDAFEIDKSKVVHTPIMNVEELKFDIMQQLTVLTRSDKVMIVVDSMGNLASKKEVQDALDQKSVADMTRAKAIKSLFRMVTPYLTLRDIPMVVVNHTYATQEMYSRQVVSGGCLVHGEKILMADGSYSEVNMIRPGELVETLQGPKMVTNIWDPTTLEFGNPPCYEVEFTDGTKVKCSNHHPFLVGNEWVDAEDLQPGMAVETL